MNSLGAMVCLLLFSSLVWAQTPSMEPAPTPAPTPASTPAPISLPTPGPSAAPTPGPVESKPKVEGEARKEKSKPNSKAQKKQETSTEKNPEKKIEKKPESLNSMTNSSTANSNRKFALGLEAGFSMVPLLSDRATGVVGIGLGYQYGLVLNFLFDRPVGIKVRADRVSMEEGILNEYSTSSIQADTFLKSVRQEYVTGAVGAEWRSSGFAGRQFFSELLIGYAFGQPSQITMVKKSMSDQTHFYNISAQSGILLSGGMGFRREIAPRLNLIFSSRMLFIFKSAYGEVFEGKTFLPVPFKFSLGLDFSF